MGLLISNLFSKPREDPKLEACLVRDFAHITPGARGDHVKKIQTALNRLSAGEGRENFTLKIDGIYGSKTAAAVTGYKNAPSRRILQPSQKTADNIVGKRTIKSLDDEMDILENETIESEFVSVTQEGTGPEHDHLTCPKARPRVTGGDKEGRAEHRGTPINPKGFGRKINIFGEGETEYLRFEDFSTSRQFASGRPVTSDPPPPFGRGLKDDCASDICFRSSPLNDVTKAEIKRIAQPLLLGGCRFTFAEGKEEIEQHKVFLLSLGVVIDKVIIPRQVELNLPEMQVLVIEILKF